ncbi:MAG: type II toxin-antitoxin system HicB family antitoxin [SAR202 cluster bacterium]|nr:type II toxin-antitoxin system HicB family antitoxin [SAR202 cluster bacterium]
MFYQVPLEISKQEDGLWRVSVPGLRGCWVDTKTLEDGISEIQECILMFIDIYQEEGRELPAGITKQNHLPLRASIFVNDAETPKPKVKRTGSKAATAERPTVSSSASFDALV